jgi:nickel and cobalt resistance protein CnrR
MKKPYAQALLFVFLLAATIIGGLYIGQQYLRDSQPHDHDKPTALHQYFHERLHITEAQDKALTKIEHRYREKRKYLEEKIKLGDMELANAISQDGKYSPRVQAAIDSIHTTMGEMQKSTIEHLFEMQTVLTPEQNQKMNQMITDALYHSQP